MLLKPKRNDMAYFLKITSTLLRWALTNTKQKDKIIEKEKEKKVTKYVLKHYYKEFLKRSQKDSQSKL